MVLDQATNNALRELIHGLFNYSVSTTMVTLHKMRCFKFNERE